MTRARPWHRSRLFWLGLPGILFLLWAWFLLDDYWLVRWTRQFGSTQIACQAGAIVLTHSTIEIPPPDSQVTVDPYPPSAQGFTQQTGPVSRAHRKYFTWPLEHKVVPTFAGAPNYHSRQITLPFWFLVPVYLAAWLTTLYFWQRRRSSLTSPGLFH